MISESRYHEAYVWVWLPGRGEPVVAGRLERVGENLIFNYGRSYLALDAAIPIYLPELPLQVGAIPPEPGLQLAGCLRDGAPDAWGRRVILNRVFGIKGKDADIGGVDELVYLLESSSDRMGALDFQLSPTTYTPRATPRAPKEATLEELLTAADKVEKGIPLSPELDQALLHASSLGGARPKSMLEYDNKKLIAKFSSFSDTYNVVKAEFIAMRLAAKSGLTVAPVCLSHVAGKDVLLVERFDRIRTGGAWHRKFIVSALTLFGLDEMMARYASYADLAQIIRYRFTQPKDTLRELFGRLVFNVLCGNTDDHARNHAAFWDGKALSLTPAYDICPQYRTGNEASQAMWITGDSRSSTLATCLDAAPDFLLSKQAAEEIILHMLKTIRGEWEAVCKEADLSEVDRNMFWERMFLNPFIFESSQGF